MDDRKMLRFTETEKAVLFSLFTKYKDIIDIRHRRYSQSQTKQTSLRKCWDSILESFNADPGTNKRSMKQIQKFWLNSKLRKRLPGEEDPEEKSSIKKVKQNVIAVKVENSAAKGGRSQVSSNATYQALVKTCKDSDNEEEQEEDEEGKLITSDDMELNSGNVNTSEQYEEEHYDSLTESYFPNDAITLKVINDPIDLGIETPAPSSIVTIPAQTQRGAAQLILPAQKQTDSASSSAATTAYTITYSSPIKDAQYNNQNIQLVKSAAGNYLITTPGSSGNIQPHLIRNANRAHTSNEHSVETLVSTQTTQSNKLVGHENLSIQEMQKQEQLLRLREATLRCEVQELEKEKAKEELIQMREIHRMKIKEMEMRLRNIERS